MDEKLLKKFLCERKENDWLEFKGKWKLYQADGTLVDRQRDELLKDILGLANGNSHTVRKTKYLIIGADDKEFDVTGMRVFHNVDYKLPSRSELTKWLQNTSSTAVAGLESEIVPFQDVNLWIITIQPTFNLHETAHELVTCNGTFQKHTVFMRQDEHIVPASVQDGVTIQNLKNLYRQEIANPQAWRIGGIAGGIIAFIIGGAKIKASQMSLPVSDSVVTITFVVIGLGLGAEIGWISQIIKETQYDWRYISTQRKLILIAMLIILAIVMFVILR